jgi:hypothetical protein
MTRTVCDACGIIYSYDPPRFTGHQGDYGPHRVLRTRVELMRTDPIRRDLDGSHEEVGKIELCDPCYSTLVEKLKDFFKSFRRR